MNILITGTSRGIGFGLTAEALSKGHHVLAVTRKTAPMQALKADYPKTLTVLEADISQLADLKKILASVADWGTLDTLINNAGVLKNGESIQDLAESFQVNATMPFLLTKELLPFIKKSKMPKVVQISTMMSSIADNKSGGAAAYRASKIALNMLTYGLKIEHPDVAFALVHPGWVKTDMGGQGALIDVEESVRGIWQVIDAMSPKNSGQFIDYNGKELPW